MAMGMLMGTDTNTAAACASLVHIPCLPVLNSDCTTSDCSALRDWSDSMLMYIFHEVIQRGCLEYRFNVDFHAQLLVMSLEPRQH